MRVVRTFPTYLKLGCLALLSFGLWARGGQESHGGNIVVCKGKEPVVLDYYHASLKGIGEAKANIEDISAWSRDRVILFFRNKLQTYLFRFEMESALFRLGEFDRWIEADLKEVNDSDEPYFLPKDCERKQGAVRQGDQVFVDPSYVGNLSPAQQGMLVVHEAIYYVANQHGLKTSVAVRHLIRTLLRKDGTAADVIRGIHGVGSLAYGFEVLVGKSAAETYLSDCGSQSPQILFERASAITRTLVARPVLGGGLFTPNNPSIITCDGDGMTCHITSPSNNQNSVLAWKGALMKIDDSGRRLTFEDETGHECVYFRSQVNAWPLPIGGDKNRSGESKD